MLATIPPLIIIKHCYYKFTIIVMHFKINFHELATYTKQSCRLCTYALHSYTDYLTIQDIQ